MRFENSSFSGGQVEIDGNHFVRCQFENTTLVFKGLSPIKMEYCEFHNVAWKFEGPAANTLSFLRAIYHGSGEFGRRLVENTFDEIRTPPPVVKKSDSQPE